jgi:hypothetical protein
MTLMIDGSPQIVTRAVDGQKDLVQVPFVPWSWTTTSQLVGIVLAEFATPFPDGFIRHDHAAGEQEFFDIAVAQAEAIIELHAVADDFRRKAVVLVTFRSGWRGHAVLPLCLPTRFITSPSS